VATIAVLADHPELIGPVAELRWSEWGKSPEPVDFDFWLDTTTAEAGRDAIPMTWVAIDDGRAVGAAGILEFDPDDFRDRSPWLVGMIVAPDRRGEGIGAELVRAFERWTADAGFDRAWVATGPAEAFYQKCGWTTVASFTNEYGDPAVVLERRLRDT
jgi:GNAT superfamily N-acetyltransferase